MPRTKAKCSYCRLDIPPQQMKERKAKRIILNRGMFTQNPVTLYQCVKCQGNNRNKIKKEAVNEQLVSYNLRVR